MGPSIVLEWLEIAEWLAVDDRLRRAIIARDALRRAGRSEHGTGTNNVNSENPDSGSDASPTPPHQTRRAPPTYPSQFSLSAFRLAGRGVF